MTPQQARVWLAAALNGEAIDPGVNRDHLLTLAIERHGVGPLLAATPFGRSLDGDAGARLAEEVRLCTLHAAILNDELRRVIAALAAAGVPVLLIKGAHLAHAVYPEPRFRPRGDTDLLVTAGTRSAADGALRACGYRPLAHVRGSVILGQFHLDRVDRSGVTHQLDVHWRVSAPLLVERLLPAALVIASRAPIPALGNGAFGPSLEHALAVACLHLAAHHWPEPDLLWLYDVRLIAQALGPEGGARFVALARSRGFAALASEVLRAAQALFPSSALRAIVDALPPIGGAREPALALMKRPKGSIDELLLDLKYAAWGERVTLVREHLLPDPAYVRASFAGSTLAGAYARRIARGSRRWLSRSTGR